MEDGGLENGARAVKKDSHQELIKQTYNSLKKTQSINKLEELAVRGLQKLCRKLLDQGNNLMLSANEK